MYFYSDCSGVLQTIETCKLLFENGLMIIWTVEVHCEKRKSLKEQCLVYPPGAMQTAARNFAESSMVCWLLMSTILAIKRKGSDRSRRAFIPNYSSGSEKKEEKKLKCCPRREKRASDNGKSNLCVGEREETFQALGLDLGRIFRRRITAERVQNIYYKKMTLAKLSLQKKIKKTDSM